MKIYDRQNRELYDILITKEAVHEEELMKSDFVRLSWNSDTQETIPTDSYIIPFPEVIDPFTGQPVRYSLLEPYTPEQKSEAEYKYEPCFQHPKMYLGKVPFTHSSRIINDESVQVNIIDAIEWSYAGALNILLDYFCECINKVIGATGDGIGYEIIGEVQSSVFAKFSTQDIFSALTNIATVQKCEWHIDWQMATLFFGHIKVSRNELVNPIVLQVGTNIGMASVRDSKEGFWNAYLPQGSNRNITYKAISGENAQSLVRVSLQPDKDYTFTSFDGTQRTIQIPDGIVYTDEVGHILSKAEFDVAGNRKHIKSVIFEEVYPRQDLYIYDVRYREKYKMDGDKKVVQEEKADGTKIYKKYAVWYLKVAKPLIQAAHVAMWEQYSLADYYSSKKYEKVFPETYQWDDRSQHAMFSIWLKDYTKESWQSMWDYIFNNDSETPAGIQVTVRVGNRVELGCIGCTDSGHVVLRLGEEYDSAGTAAADETGMAFYSDALVAGQIIIEPRSTWLEEIWNYMPQELERSQVYIDGTKPYIAFQANTYKRLIGEDTYKYAQSSPLAGRGNGDGDGHYGFEIFPITREDHIRAEMTIYNDDVATDVSQLPNIEIGDIKIIFQEQGDYVLPSTPAQRLIPKGALKDDGVTEITSIDEMNALANKDDGYIGNKINFYNIVMEDNYTDKAERELATEVSKYIKNQFIDNNSYTFKSNPIVFKDNNPNLYLCQSVIYRDLAGYQLETRVIKLVTNLDLPYVQEITVGNEILKGVQQQLKDKVETVLNGSGGGDGTGGMNRTQVLSLLSSWVTPRFIQKTIADTAEKVITFTEGIVSKARSIFEKGFWLGSSHKYGIDENGVAELETIIANTISADAAHDFLQILKSMEVQNVLRVKGLLKAILGVVTPNIHSDNYTGDGAFDTGFSLSKGADGITNMVVDNLFVRMKAIFTELEIRKISYAGGNIIFSHAGSKVVMVKWLDANGNETENLANAVKFRCYFMKDDGTTATENWWRVYDLARCQTFNVVEPGHYQNVSNTYYWRLVVAVGSEDITINGETTTYDYADLSKEDRYHTGQFDSDIPQSGDQIVQMGNRLDTTRQGFITIEVSGENAPAFKVYKNVTEYNLEGKQKICISPNLTDLRVQKLVIETEYDVQQTPMERGNWLDIAVDGDGNRRCYYRDLVQHNKASWICTYPESGIDGVRYTTEEPSLSATYWKVYAANGADAATLFSDKQVISVPTDNSGVVLADFHDTVNLTLYASGQEVNITSLVIDEGAHEHYFTARNIVPTDEATSGADYDPEDESIIIDTVEPYGEDSSYIEADYNTVELGDIDVDEGDTLDEHAAIITAHGTDSSGNAVTASVSINIVRQYIAEDGDSITKVSETPYYIKNITGTRPAEDDPNWDTTKPTLNKGEWLFTKVVILWSDNSTTVLYTDERNPNDGQPGMDIVAGTTTIQYKLTETNVQPTSGWGNYPDVLTQGWYLWSKATTPYYKDHVGGTSAGESVTYNVSYIAEDGTNGRALKSQTEYYMADSSNAEKQVPTSTTGWSDNPNVNNWNETNKYLWNMEQVVYTESDGTETTTYTKPHILAIWTKNGKGIDSIQNYYKISASNTDVVVDDFNTEGSYSSIGYTTRYNNNTTQCSTITFTGNAITDNAFSGVLKIGGVFHAGDVINIRPFTQMSASQISSGKYANVGLYNSDKNRVAFLTSNDGGATASDSSSSRSVTDGHEESGTPALFTYTLSQDITDLYIGRASGSVRINLLLIEITRNSHTIVKWENGVLTMTGDDGTWTTTTQVPTDEKPYLWNYEQITWLNSDGTTSITKTDPRVIGSRGAKGTNGYNTATVPLYQRYAPTQQNPTPALPNGTLTYTFSTGLLTPADSPYFNGWSQRIPAYEEGKKLFVTMATARSQETTDAIAASEWATPIEYVADGKNGENAVRIDLDNQTDLISLDSNKKVRFTKTVVVNASIYDGAVRATSGVRHGMTPAQMIIGACQPTITSSNGIVTITWVFTKGMDMSSAVWEKDIQLTYNSHNYSGRFSLGTTDADAIWQIIPTPSSLSFSTDSNNQLTPPNIVAKCGYVKTTGSGTESVENAITTSGQIGTTGMYLYYRTKANGSWGAWTAYPTAGVTINNSTTDTDIEFCITQGTIANDNSNIIDREVVPIVKDGLAGAPGINHAVVMIYKRAASRPNNSDRPANGVIYTFADGSLSGTLNGWTTNIPDGSNPCWMRQATALGTGTTDTIDSTEWSGDTNGNAIKFVENGAQGTAGVNVLCSPAAIIVNQSLETPSNLSYLSEVVTFTVMKGTTPITPYKIEVTPETVDNYPHCQVSGSNSNTATLTEIKTYRQDNKDYYYDRTFFTAKVFYTDGGSNKSIDGIKINIAANLIGTWKEKIEGDTKQAIAESTWFDLDANGNIVESDRLGTFEQSSKKALSRLDEQTYVTVKSDQDASFEIGTAGDYRIVLDMNSKSGESYTDDETTITLNTSPVTTWEHQKYYDRLEKTVTLTAGRYTITASPQVTIVNLAVYYATKTKYSEIEQTVDSINQTVSGPNGLSQRMQTAESNISTVKSEALSPNKLDYTEWYNTGEEAVNISSVNYEITCDPSQEENDVDLYSQLFYLDAGIYTFSAFFSDSEQLSETPNEVYVYHSDIPIEAGEGDSFTISLHGTSECDGVYYRNYGMFSLSEKKYVRINVYRSGEAVDFMKPMLHNGNTTSAATLLPYNPNLKVASESGILQTSQEISLGVQTDIEGKLTRTGININNRTVDIQADNFSLHNNSGEKTMGVDSYGNMYVKGAILYDDVDIVPVDGYVYPGQAIPLFWFNQEGKITKLPTSTIILNGDIDYFVEILLPPPTIERYNQETHEYETIFSVIGMNIDLIIPARAVSSSNGKIVLCVGKVIKDEHLETSGDYTPIHYAWPSDYDYTDGGVNPSFFWIADGSTGTTISPYLNLSTYGSTAGSAGYNTLRLCAGYLNDRPMWFVKSFTKYGNVTQNIGFYDPQQNHHLLKFNNGVLSEYIEN